MTVSGKPQNEKLHVRFKFADGDVLVPLENVQEQLLDQAGRMEASSDPVISHLGRQSRRKAAALIAALASKAVGISANAVEASKGAAESRVLTGKRTRALVLELAGQVSSKIRAGSASRVATEVKKLAAALKTENVDRKNDASRVARLSERRITTLLK